MKKNKVIFGSIVIVTFIVALIVWKKYMIVLPIVSSGKAGEKCGVIDGCITREYKEVVYEGNIQKNSQGLSHGDMLIEFIQSYNDGLTIFYYNSEEEGKIKSENIIQGLEWMCKHNVKHVSISLSSRYYSKELDEWISAHKGELAIYASYSNEISTIDYPAQYSGVTGIGCNSKIGYKDNDVCFRSNSLLFISPNGIRIYKGNSYLTPLYMLQNL